MATDKQTVISASRAILVICCGLVSLTKAQWLIDDDGCRTPYRGVGTCMPVKQCKPMRDFIAQSSSLTPQVISVLQGYQCGYEGNSVKVCCPDGPIIVQKPEKPVPAPPDVGNHRNLNLLPYDCGAQATERIIGGNKTSLFEYPWMALLSYETGNGLDFRCGGTIINNRYILTAAHCITHLTTLKLVGVRVGEYNISSALDCEKPPFGDEFCAPPVQDVLVGEAIPHPRYNTTTFTDDIGLIRLATPINTNVESVKPICLPITNELKKLDLSASKLTVTGWGATETGRRSPDLLQVNIPIVGEKECIKAYAKSPAVITHRQLCAGGQNKTDSCGGDSGGPLQTFTAHHNDARFVQFGIVSFGPRFCGQEGFPGVYTRIEYYMDWILDNMKA